MDRPVLDDELPVNPSSNPTFQAVLAARLSRRGFLGGIGAGLATLAAMEVGARGAAEGQATLPFTPVGA
jgi:secreted PhoX family phosphatase